MTSVEKYWSRVRLRAGLEDLHLHDLRRSLISSLSAQGVPSNIIQRIVNHAKISTTEGYVVPSDSQIVADTLASHAERLLAVGISDLGAGTKQGQRHSIATHDSRG